MDSPDETVNVFERIVVRMFVVKLCLDEILVHLITNING